MSDPRYVQPEPATVPPSPWLADCKPFKPYVYRGQGYDVYEEFDHSEIPASCTCTWEWGPPAFRWVRIGPKETCPWHQVGDALMRKVTGP